MSVEKNITQKNSLKVVPKNARLNEREKSSFTFIDLFAGAGGLSLGLEQAGFLPVFVNEIVPQFNETYRKNRNLSDEQYFVGDIKKLNEKIDEYLPRFKDADLVCGGPPCQGFSMANRQRIIDDPRNQLYKEYLKLLSVVRPKFCGHVKSHD